MDLNNYYIFFRNIKQQYQSRNKSKNGHIIFIGSNHGCGCLKRFFRHLVCAFPFHLLPKTYFLNLKPQKGIRKKYIVVSYVCKKIPFSLKLNILWIVNKFDIRPEHYRGSKRKPSTPNRKGIQVSCTCEDISRRFAILLLFGFIPVFSLSFFSSLRSTRFL